MCFSLLPPRSTSLSSFHVGGHGAPSTSLLPLSNCCNQQHSYSSCVCLSLQLPSLSPLAAALLLLVLLPILCVSLFFLLFLLHLLLYLTPPPPRPVSLHAQQLVFE